RAGPGGRMLFRAGILLLRGGSAHGGSDRQHTEVHPAAERGVHLDRRRPDDGGDPTFGAATGCPGAHADVPPLHRTLDRSVALWRRCPPMVGICRFTACPYDQCRLGDLDLCAHFPSGAAVLGNDTEPWAALAMAANGVRGTG